MKQIIAVLVLSIAVIGCAAPATPTSILPVQAPATSTKLPVAATASPTVASVASSTGTCTTANAAPPDKFRADDPAKLDAPGKPKLVEFFAYW